MIPKTLPAPPKLKTTIIQLNKDIDPEDHNYEVLSNDYNQNPNSYGNAEEAPKKKRRRSSSFVDKDELARRKAETKQLHSMIEKRRRIKINREFEALQYLIPACRSMDGGSKKGGIRNASNKSEGMYKLTILKTSVEYILYLHHIVQKQHEMLRMQCPDYEYDISYSEVPLDVNQYRNIDQEYVFAPEDDIIPEERPEKDTCYENSDQSSPSAKNSHSPSDDHLVTPEVTPVMACMQAPKYRAKGDGFSSSFRFQGSRRTGSLSSETSPFTIPVKSQVKLGFSLPDPALTYVQNQINGAGDVGHLQMPQRKMFKSKIPDSNSVVNLFSAEQSRAEEDVVSVARASEALLTFRKPSIERLLN